MGDLKGFLKNIVVNICDGVDLDYPSIRMSDLANTSLTTTCENYISQSQEVDIIEPKNTSFSSKRSSEILNNSVMSLDVQTDQQLHQIHNDTKEFEKSSDRKLDENENVEDKTKLKLMITKTSFNNVNDDITKSRSDDVQRNSSQFAFPVGDTDDSIKHNYAVINAESKTTNDRINRQKQTRPIMGRNALLKKANIDRSDSLIVQDIILDKYNPVINHYVTRMYHRRLSRTRLDSTCDDEYFSDGGLSSGTSCSPMSISSIGSERLGFTFPSIEEVDQNQSDVPQHERINRSRRTDSFKTALDNTFSESTNLINAKHNSSILSNAGTTFSEYDPEKFLNNALGDVTSFSESGICNKLSEKHTSTRCGDSSIGSEDISLLVSKVTSLYSSLKKGLRRKRSSIKSKQFLPVSEQSLNNIPENPHLNTLKRELAVQNGIMFQISKALVYCRSSKIFMYSPEHVEAEKILLVALLTKEALVNEINAIEFNNYQNNDDPRNKGEITISSIKFLPNENHFDLTNEIEQNIIKECFLVVLVCGGRVLASKVLMSDEKGCLKLDNCFVFKDLTTDFEVSLAVYSMLIKDRAHLSQENINCPTPKNLFSFHKDPKKFYKVVSEVPYITTSAFRLLGKCCIRNAELSKSEQQSLNLHDSPVHSRLSPVFTAKVESKIHLDVRVGGFLTIGMENEQSCTIWNRRWCVLENSMFKYWNYPSEEAAAPLGIVDLACCIEQNISVAERISCARPRTILVPIKCGINVKKYLLSADSAKDMEIWIKELNFVIKSLRTWNCMS